MGQLAWRWTVGGFTSTEGVVGGREVRRGFLVEGRGDWDRSKLMAMGG